MLIAATISFQCYHIHYLKFFSKQNLKLISTPTHLQLQLIHTKISDYLKYVPYTTLSKVICILHSASLTCQTVRLNELSLLALAYFMLVCKCYLVINFWTPRCKRWKNGTKFQSQEVILSTVKQSSWTSTEDKRQHFDISRRTDFLTMSVMLLVICNKCK